ncbi:MAG: pyridoxal phosphate-dependent aminotransferase [Planctomycetota bacterium]|jgi:aspartate aminotransferase
MPVAKKIDEAMTRASFIRKMFEKGTELKRIHGVENVFDLTLGNPVLEPPPEFFHALAELAKRRDEGLHGYMPNAGFPAVRERIAAKLDREGVLPGITKEEIVMTVGAAGGMNTVLKAILNPGEEVLLLAPYFVEYNFYAFNHGGVPVVAETREDFDIDVDAVAAKISAKTRAVIVNSPNNPSGRVYPRATLEAFASMLAEKEKEHGSPIYVLSDEPYRELAYIDEPLTSPVQVHPNSFLVYSWSKSLSVPGERIGFVALNPQADDPAGLSAALNFTVRTLGYVNAPAAMQLIAGDLLDVTVDVGWYRARRDRFVKALQEMGFELTPPEGAFYIFPKSPDPDDVAFVNRAMEKNVLIVPGSGFGRKGYFRIAFCVDDRTIDGGIEGLRQIMV